MLHSVGNLTNKITKFLLQKVPTDYLHRLVLAQKPQMLEVELDFNHQANRHKLQLAQRDLSYFAGHRISARKSPIQFTANYLEAILKPAKLNSSPVLILRQLGDLPTCTRKVAGASCLKIPRLHLLQVSIDTSFPQKLYSAIAVRQDFLNDPNLYY